MLDLIKANLHVIVAALFSIFEYWLGKTDKVKAGSTLELVINLIRGAVRKFLGQSDPPPVA